MESELSHHLFSLNSVYATVQKAARPGTLSKTMSCYRPDLEVTKQKQKKT